ILNCLEVMVPCNIKYKHSEGNAPAHVKSSLMGSSVSIIVNDGRLALGTWQGIYFCEFDGPRTRKVYIKFIEG
ncbi:MAG: secondary thiamine-phosphate synthase enzyme YjbQ, partial [Candidatus Omnitrophica bacterium]|nr:secondary thiamine-phosphate synthase enzyme YjbQ [Candidatus Omnitrophota bacterium]